MHWFLHSAATANFFLDDLVEEALRQRILENQCGFFDARSDPLNQVFIGLNPTILQKDP